ncbi:MAG: hypothetical protein JW841_17690 [Deltaproteobacteria bacterium]|nr:hypothetical protein [Deltaproteobacteria bacterium]
MIIDWSFSGTTLGSLRVIGVPLLTIKSQTHCRNLFISSWSSSSCSSNPATVKERRSMVVEALGGAIWHRSFH